MLCFVHRTHNNFVISQLELELKQEEEEGEAEGGSLLKVNSSGTQIRQLLVGSDFDFEVINKGRMEGIIDFCTICRCHGDISGMTSLCNENVRETLIESIQSIDIKFTIST